MVALFWFVFAISLLLSFPKILSERLVCTENIIGVYEVRESAWIFGPDSLASVNVRLSTTDN
jgi:hypothetical protein